MSFEVIESLIRPDAGESFMPGGVNYVTDHACSDRTVLEADAQNPITVHCRTLRGFSEIGAKPHEVRWVGSSFAFRLHQEKDLAWEERLRT